MSNEVVFTPASVLSLLTEIEELKDKEISFEETESSIIISIDDSQYTVDTSAAQEVEVDEEALDTVSEANEEGYQDLVDENEDASFESEEEDTEVTEEDEEGEEPVEGGIIKEIAKTLLVGGLVRLTTNMLKNQ